MTKRKGRSDAATIDTRVDVVATLILEGQSTSKICRNAAVTKWNVGQRQVEAYIAKARDQIRGLGEFDKVTEYGKAIARLEHIYAQAVKGKDWTAARGAVKDLMQMFGIAGPIHVVTDADGGAVTSWVELVRAAERAAPQAREATDG